MIKSILTTITLAITLGACNQTLPVITNPSSHNPHSLGLMEIRFSGTGGASPTSSAVLVSSGQTRALTDVGSGLQLQPFGTSMFQAGGMRYLSASFKVRNASAASLPFSSVKENVVFMAVSVPGQTIAGTAFKGFSRFASTSPSVDNSSYSDNVSLRNSIARSITPSHGMGASATGVAVTDNAADFMAFSEAEVDPTLWNPVTSLSSLGVSTVFPFGYSVRCASNCANSRSLAANPSVNQFDGFVTFAVKLPTQTDARDNPFAFSIMVEALENTPSRVTMSPEEGLDFTGVLIRANNASIGTVYAIGTGSRTVSPQPYQTLLTSPLSQVTDFTGVANVRVADPDPGDANSSRLFLLPSGQTAPTFTLPARTEMVSFSPAGAQTTAASGATGSSISDDGRFVALRMIVPSSSVPQIVVRDRVNGSSLLVSSTNGTILGNFTSEAPAISGDGRVVAFLSQATNLGNASAASGSWGVFVKDIQRGTIERIDVATDNTYSSIDSSGGLITTLGLNIFRPAISTDGRFVAFTSQASNLVANDTNNVTDVFLRDRKLGITSRISLNNDGSEISAGGSLPAINSDGRYIAFASNAGVWVRDSLGATTVRADIKADGTPQGGSVGGNTTISISGNGRRVAYDTTSAFSSLDTNNKNDVFVRDLDSNATTWISALPD
jgi:WD40-like Beta Propeller Repeat